MLTEKIEYDGRVDARQTTSGMTLWGCHSRNPQARIQKRHGYPTNNLGYDKGGHSRSFLAGIQKRHGCPTNNLGHDKGYGYPTDNLGYDRGVDIRWKNSGMTDVIDTRKKHGLKVEE
ncbi:MAG: hypothetical protein A4E71_02127 [Smithella sp. PtaU1.Bin162]|nr:MAG: hypothetical protein A4E71_02127 [Smithella sp. PtaU1.Bin162]